MVKQVKEVVRKYLPEDRYEVFIFGSRAKRKNRRFSDIDLGISGKKALRGSVKVKIQEELENSKIPYKVDLVDFSLVSEKFRQSATRDIVYL